MRVRELRGCVSASQRSAAWPSRRLATRSDDAVYLVGEGRAMTKQRVRERDDDVAVIVDQCHSFGLRELEKGVDPPFAANLLSHLQSD